MKLDLRKCWKWLALVAVVAAATLWFALAESPVVTTLRLDQPASDGPGNELWFVVRSSRSVGLVTTKYSIEAQIPSGLTNYDAPPFGHVLAIFEGGGAIPIRVTVPNANEFRVKVVVEEYGALISTLESWTVRRPSVYKRVYILIDWLNRLHRKGTLTTVWSPWLVRSNNIWMEKAER